MAGSTIRAWSARSSTISDQQRPTASARSTITQQVAKNLLLTNEYSVYPQDPRGDPRPADRGDADQAADPRALSQPDLPRPATPMACRRRAAPISTRMSASSPCAQMAFLAILPKAPDQLTIRSRIAERALARRNFVLGEMLRNGFITAAQHDAAVAEPLGPRVSGSRDGVAQCRRLFHGGGPPPADRALRRECRATARTASMPAACGCAPPMIPRCRRRPRRAARRACRATTRPRLARPVCDDRDRRRLARAARRRAIRHRLRRLARGGRAFESGRQREIGFADGSTGTSARLRRDRCRSAATAARPSTRCGPARSIAVKRASDGVYALALDPRSVGRLRGRGSPHRAASWRCRAASTCAARASTARPRRCASRDRRSSRSSIRPRSTTA